MKIKVMPLEETGRRTLPEGDLGFGSLVTNRMFRQSYNP